MIASVLGASSGAGFSTSSTMPTTSASGSLSGVSATLPYLSISSRGTSIRPITIAAVLGLDVEHRAEQRVALVDQVVGQQHGDRLTGAELLALRDRVAEALRLVLVDLVDARRATARGGRGRACRPCRRGPASSSSFGRKCCATDALVRVADDQDVGDAGARGLAHDELERRRRDDGREFLRHGLGERQEARAATGCGDQRLADAGEAVAGAALRARHAPDPTSAVSLARGSGIEGGAARGAACVHGGNDPPAALAQARDAVRRVVLDRCAAEGWTVVAAYVPLRTEPGSIELLDDLVRRTACACSSRSCCPTTTSTGSAWDDVERPARRGRDRDRRRGAGPGARGRRRRHAARPRRRLLRPGAAPASGPARRSPRCCSTARPWRRLPAEPWDVPVTAIARPGGWESRPLRPIVSSRRLRVPGPDRAAR